jgi:hypothetical protein
VYKAIKWKEDWQNNAELLDFEQISQGAKITNTEPTKLLIKNRG